MAKDKHSKERARAKRNREQKLRNAKRKHKERQVVNLMLEGLSSGSARGMAAFWSRDYSSGGMGREVPVPSYYEEFLAQLSQRGVRTELDTLMEALLRTELNMDSLAPGFAIILSPFGRDIVALPTCLFSGSTNPKAWMERAVAQYTDTELVLWITWVGHNGNSVPNVYAIDGQGRLAAWFLDDEIRWFSVSRGEAFFVHEAGEPMDPTWWDEAGMSQAFDALGVELDSSFKVKPDDPRVIKAVEISIAAQQPVIDAFLVMSQRNNEGEMLLDALASENDKIGRLEQEVAVMQRRLTKAEQERDAARALLANERAAQQGQPKLVQISLGDRLAKIFG